MKKVKGLLAVVLCVCMVVACYPIQLLQAASTLYKEQENVPSYTLNGTRTDVYYEDDFTTEETYTNALGAYANNTSRLKWSKGGIAPDGSTRNALFYGIKEAEKLQNYTLTADVKMNNETKFTALTVYGSGDTVGNASTATGYEFGIVKDDQTNLVFRLYQRGDTQYIAGGKADNYVGNYFSETDFDYTTDTVTMRISVETNTEKNVVIFNCYAALNGGTEVPIFTNVKDETGTVLLSGVPGFRSTDTTGGLISNVSVTSTQNDAAVLYHDDYSSAQGYTRALGTPNNGNLSLVDNELLIDTQANHVSLFKGIEGAENLQNYTVSAEFVFDDDDGFNGLVAYGSQHPTTTNDSYGYEFAVVSGKFRLYRRDNKGTSDKLAGYTSSDSVATIFAEEEYAVGQPITLSLTVATLADGSVSLTGKATYKGAEKIYTAIDKSDSKITQGIPGIRGTNNGCTVDSVTVTKLLNTKVDIPFTETFDRTREDLASVWSNGNSVTVENVSDNAQAVLGDNNIKNMYINNADEWTNYIYEADVTMTDEPCDTATIQVAAICGGANNSSSGYEFGLLYNESLEQQYWVRLYDRAAGKDVGVGVTAVKTGREPYNFTIGQTVRLRMEIEGNTIRCYAGGVLLITYTAANGTVIKGGIGLRANGYKAKYDNLLVAEAGTISIPELETGRIQLYQGFEVSPYDYTVDVTYANGSTENIPMTFDMIGEYDNVTPGDRDISVYYEGKATKLPITVLERPEYIQEFVSAVDSCKSVESITLEDKTAVDALEELYKSLSGYELSTVEEGTLEKYKAVIEAMYKLEHPILAEYDMVAMEDFHDALDEADWVSAGHSVSGTWRTINGVLYNEQARYGWNDKISLVKYEPFYGEINSVEADVMVTNADNGFASLFSCMGEAGYYHVRITKATKWTLIWKTEIVRVQLYKNAGSHTLLATKDTDIEFSTEQWYNLRLTTIDGQLEVYLDDTLVLKYDDSTSSDYMTSGTFGFRTLYGDMRYDSLRVMGTDLSSEQYVPQIEATSYADDFEDEVTGKNPSHWIETTDSDNWKVYDKNGSQAYGTKTNALTYSWLHTFESDPTITLDFMVENAGQTGRIEFLTRYTQAVYSYAGIGYDFSQSKWYIYCARGEDFEPRTTYANAGFELTTGQWYNLKIEENGTNIKVYVNEELVIEETNAYMTGYGRIGVLSEHANLFIDNFTYTMPHGEKVDDGVIEYIFDDDVYGTLSHLEIESLGGEQLLGVYGSNKRFLSNDNGVTWTKTDLYADVKAKGLGYPSILQLSEGTYLMVYADTFEVYKSTDYMNTWTKVGQILTDVGDNLSTSGEWENLIHVNALTKVTLENGTVRIFLPIATRRFDAEGNTYTGHYTRIFYSDDEGKSWTESKNDTRGVVPNYSDDTNAYFSWAEAKIIQCADGRLRMYNTRQYDSVVYMDSFDDGETWEGFGSVMQLQNGQTSYGITEDPQNLGTYYMVCINAKAITYNSMQPRNRLTLAKSTDGMNWEFVTDIERFTSYSGYESAELYQIIDPSISIINGYMYVTMGRSYNGSTKAHGEQSVLLVRLEMDKLSETSEWNDSNIADPTKIADYYEVSSYRGSETYTYPTKTGYVFAGWYKDKEFTLPLDKAVTRGRAYAKFVDENVLSVKAQVDATTTAESNTTRMRFVTTVDSLDYNEVGFTVSTSGKTKTYSSTTVYESLKAVNLEVDYTPKGEFSATDSLYFATLILKNVAVAGTDLNRAFTVTPYWVTLDGTTVTGIIRNDITIQKGIDVNSKTNNSSAYSGR